MEGKRGTGTPDLLLHSDCAHGLPLLTPLLLRVPYLGVVEWTNARDVDTW